jgi:hypothetical protein
MVVRKEGRIIEEYEDKNMIMNVAKDAMARLIGGDGAGKIISDIGFGTNVTGPSPDDIGLTAAYSKPVVSVEYPATGQAAFHWSLGTSEANGKEITELGLLCSDGTLFARKVRGAIKKESDLSLDGVWTIIF